MKTSLKGQSTEIFDPLLSSIELACTDQWVQIFLIFVKIAFHTAQNQSPHGIKQRIVNLSAVSCCAESISPQYHTAGSHVTFPDPF